jgi:AraC-like DNA-binding protein
MLRNAVEACLTVGASRLTDGANRRKQRCNGTEDLRNREDAAVIGSYLASDIRIVLRYLDSIGVASEPLLREAGLDPRLLGEPRARYPFAKVVRLWESVAEHSPARYPGLYAARMYRPTDFHGLAVAFLASSTIGTGLARLVRYHAIINTALTLELVHGADRVDLVSGTLDLDARIQRILENMRAAIIIDLCREGTGDDFAPIEVGMTTARPEDTSEHEAVFGCPVAFDQPRWRISFRRDDLQRPFLASNRELARGNDEILARVVAGLQSEDIVSRVKMALIDRLPSGTPSEDQVARAVSLSTRSLQRRLAEQRTNFTRLLASVRKELAVSYVRDPQVPITEISYLLGFSDVSSFSRAFKRWTGISPLAAREQAG